MQLLPKTSEHTLDTAGRLFVEKFSLIFIKQPTNVPALLCLVITSFFH